MANSGPLHCPFCGRRASFGKGLKSTITEAWVWRPVIGCAHCHIKREFDSIEGALTWWNNRYNTDGTATA